MQNILGAIDDFTLAIGKTYSTGGFSGEGVNVFRVIVVWIPTVLSFILKDKLINDGSRAENLFINLSMLNAEIMFLGLFGTANYFARLANFFLIFQTISLPVIIQKYPVAERKFLTTGSIIGYSLYFIYANTIAQGGFDNNYFGISFFDYINNIFV
jgi:transmembrane protein EpsG